MTPVIIVAIVFVFTLSIVRMGLAHEKEKMAIKYGRKESGGADRSMTTSELEDMIRRAVEEATGDMQERLAQMERRLARLAAADAPEGPLLDLDADYAPDLDRLPEEPPAAARASRRVH